jgi:small-conductance mechanosensitive channel
MVVVVVVGYIAARFVARLFTALCEKIGLQVAAERSGLAQSMQHIGIKRNGPAIVGLIVFWLLMCVFGMAAFNILGLEKLSSAMGKLVDYIPNLLVATVVVVVGLLIASFLRGLVATSADRLGVSYAEHLANGCYYVLALLTFIAAFNQLKFEFALMDNLIMIAFGGLALGFGLSFGLGGRDVMAGILAGYYLRQRLNAGDHVSISGMEGTVREVGPVATILETDEHGLINRHTVPNTKMLNEAVR